MSSGDLIAAVEACYTVDRTDDAWLEGVLGAARPHLDCGLGVCSYVYDASDPSAFQARPLIGVGASRSREFLDRTQASLVGLPAEYVRRTFLSLQVSRVSHSIKRESIRALFDQLRAPVGAADIVAVNALDPTGHGVYLGVPLPARAVLTPSRMYTWRRLAAHIATANRLRRRLRNASGHGEAPVEARVDPSGRVEPLADSADAADARTALAHAAHQLERARGDERASHPERALGRWKSLVEGRWTLVDEFERRGRRYLLARRNAVEVQGPAALTPRERELVAYALLGHSNKVIAYELGLSVSTVGVLLARAARRLGVRSRRELLLRMAGHQ